MNAGAELNKLKKYVTKTCTKCGVTYRGYEKSTQCKKCYNTEWVRNKRAKLNKIGEQS